METKNEEFISLREAAKISGYAPDYIGQLIRSGKLEGRQVFSNVAWMTTEEALLSYLAKDTKKITPARRQSLLEQLTSAEAIESYYLAFSWLLIVCSSVFILFLAYVAAVSIDHTIEQRYLKNISINHDT
jgi:ribonuclease HII